MHQAVTLPSESHPSSRLEGQADERTGSVAVQRSRYPCRKARMQDPIRIPADLARELTTRQAWLEAVLQQMPQGVVVAEAPSGRLVLGNEQVARIWRHPFLPAQDVQEYRQYQGYHLDGRPYQPQEWPVARSIRTGERVTDEVVKILRGDGTWGFISVSSAPIRDPDGRIIAGVITFSDITDRTLAEDQIGSMAMFPEENPSPVMRVSGQGVLLYANQASSDLLATWSCRAGQQVPAEVLQMVAQCLVDGTPREADHECAGRVFSIMFAPLAGMGYANLYGRDITRRRQAEDALRQSHEQLKALNETLEHRVAERTAVAEDRAAQLRLLASQLSQAEERERQRVAHILHDHFQQLLAGAKFDLGFLDTHLCGDEGCQAPAVLERVNQVLDQAITESRTLSVELSPPVLQATGLCEALHWLGRWMQDKHGLQVDVQAEKAGEPRAQDRRSLLFHAVRELLFNVVKHAHTNRAAVRLVAEQDYTQVTVEDGGVGFDPERLQVKSDLASGFGLFGLRERLELLDGQLRIESRPGEGTRIHLRVSKS